MKRSLVTCAIVCLLTVVAGQQALAQRDRPPGDELEQWRVFPPGTPAGDRRSDADRYGNLRRPHDGHTGQTVVVYSPPLPYRYDYPPHYYPERYYIAPLYIRAEELYGPQALARFLGWDTADRQPPVINIVLPSGNVLPGGALDQAGLIGLSDALDPEPARPHEQRGTNQQALALAWKFIGYSDAHFAEGDYSVAYQGYRKAAEAAPLLGDSYFRQGYALIALGRYEQAAQALRKGLARNPDWPSSGFSNQELYGGDELARKVHLEVLAEAADREPRNADLMFLLGVFLHFDDQPAEAAQFFRIAARLGGQGDVYLTSFLGE